MAQTCSLLAFPYRLASISQGCPEPAAPRSSAVHPRGSRPESRPRPAQSLPSGTRQNPLGLSNPRFQVPRPAAGVSGSRLGAGWKAAFHTGRCRAPGPQQSALRGPFFVDGRALMPRDSPPLREVQAAHVPRGWAPQPNRHRALLRFSRGAPRVGGWSHALALLLAQWGQAGPRQNLPPATRPAPGRPEQTAAFLGLSALLEPSVTEPPQLLLGPSICHPFPNSLAGDGPRLPTGVPRTPDFRAPLGEGPQRSSNWLGAAAWGGGPGSGPGVESLWRLSLSGRCPRPCEIELCTCPWAVRESWKKEREQALYGDPLPRGMGTMPSEERGSDVTRWGVWCPAQGGGRC